VALCSQENTGALRDPPEALQGSVSCEHLECVARHRVWVFVSPGRAVSGVRLGEAGSRTGDTVA
jgi:hypothetical protein